MFTALISVSFYHSNNQRMTVHHDFAKIELTICMPAFLIFLLQCDTGILTPISIVQCVNFLQMTYLVGSPVLFGLWNKGTPNSTKVFKNKRNKESMFSYCVVKKTKPGMVISLMG